MPTLKNQPAALAVLFAFVLFVATDITSTDAGLPLNEAGLKKAVGPEGAFRVSKFLAVLGKQPPTSLPNISILTPITTERCNAFSHNLVRNLQRSTYEAHKLELVVVVSGPGRCKDLDAAAEEDERIKVHFHHVPEGKNLDTGIVRNEAVAWATGDIIVNMDDDDVYGPSYISFMVTKLLSDRTFQLVNLHDYLGLAVKKDGTMYFQVGRMGEKTGATYVFRRSVRTDHGCEYTNTTGQDENRLHACIISNYGQQAIHPIEIANEPEFKTRQMYIKSSWVLQTTALNFKNEAVARRLGYEPLTATDHDNHFEDAVVHKLVGHEKKLYLDRVAKALNVLDMLLSFDQPASKLFHTFKQFCGKTGDMQLYNCIAAA